MKNLELARQYALTQNILLVAYEGLSQANKNALFAFSKSEAFKMFNVARARHETVRKEIENIQNNTCAL